MDNILRMQGINSRGESRVPLDQFRAISQEHLMRVSYAKQFLRKASIPFQGKGDIRPIHCKSALDSLNEVNERIEDFKVFFYTASHLPLVITALRYQTLHVLHRIEIQTSQLEELLDGYRTICMTSSKRAQKQRIDIYNSFETLLQSLADISQQVTILNDEARFQEGRLLSFSE